MFPAVHPDEARVLVAFDGTSAAYDALAWAAHWTSAGGTVVALVVERLRPGDHGRALAAAAADRALRGAREWMRDCAPATRFRTIAAHGGARSMIEESCHDADLLVVARGSRRSLSGRLAHEATVPVVVLPMRVGAPTGDVLVERLSSATPAASALAREAEWRLRGDLRIVDCAPPLAECDGARLLVIRRSVAEHRGLLTRPPCPMLVVPDVPVGTFAPVPGRVVRESLAT